MDELVQQVRLDNDNSTDHTSEFDLKYFPQSQLLVESLSDMFPEQSYEDKLVLKAKEILGDKYSTEEIKSLISSFEYLIADWLEEYEKNTFNNKTLKELLENLSN